MGSGAAHPGHGGAQIGNKQNFGRSDRLELLIKCDAAASPLRTAVSGSSALFAGPKPIGAQVLHITFIVRPPRSYSAHLRAGVAPDCDVVAYEEEGESALHGAPGRVSDDEDDEEESELH